MRVWLAQYSDSRHGGYVIGVWEESESSQGAAVESILHSGENYGIKPTDWRPRTGHSAAVGVNTGDLVSEERWPSFLWKT